MPSPRQSSHRPSHRPTRRIAAVLLALAVLPGVLLHDRNQRFDHGRELAIKPLAVPAAATAGLGPFRLGGAWQLISNDYLFGGYSALLPRPAGRLLAISDRDNWLEFAQPDSGPDAAPGPTPGPARQSHDHAMGHIMRDRKEWNLVGDSEAATTDVAPGQPGGHIWISWEGRRAISRFDAAPGAGWWHERRGAPKEIKNWSLQYGGESLVRLPDGRFILISEDFTFRSYERRHLTLVFPGDPTEPGAAAPATGELTADEGYRPTDVARLPDGRMLLLLRRLIWPLPLRFSCRIALVDPQDLLRTGRWTARTLARLDPPLPTDNYEGLTVRPRADGKVDVWVIADDNRAATQRSLLLKLELDPRDLPARKN